jgi:hypothetical protein
MSIGATESHWSLARQYLLASLAVVLASVGVTGAWIGHQIETSVLDRTAGVTALYVDSFLSSNLQDLARDDRWLTQPETAALDQLVADTGLGQGVVLFKIWSLDGRVLYSPDRSLVDQIFPIDWGLAQAANGEVAANMSTLDQPENVNERGRWSRLVQVYAPVREDSDGRVIAVKEFYLLPDALDLEIHDAQLRAWALVSVIGLCTYLLLAGIVRRGSDTIRRQQTELQQRLDQNLRLHERVRQAAGRTTALNEQALRRISADARRPGPGAGAGPVTPRRAAGTVCRRRQRFAERLRLCHGPRRGARRAERSPGRRSGTPVARSLFNLPEQAPLPIKIALLRTLQEALSNATRHGRGEQVDVRLTGSPDGLQLTVSDHGPGFDPVAATHADRLGLAGMRERAELLSGTFAVESTPGAGTVLRVCWPLLVRAQL